MSKDKTQSSVNTFAKNLNQDQSAEVKPTTTTDNFLTILRTVGKLQGGAHGLSAVQSLQRVVGNRAAARLLSIPPAHTTNAPMIQRVEDPEKVIFHTIRAAYVKVYKEYKNMTYMDSPSNLKNKIANEIAAASTEEQAYEFFADNVLKDFLTMYNNWDIRRQNFIDECKIQAALTTTKNVENQERLRKIREQEDAEEKPTTSTTSEKKRPEKRVFLDEEQEAITEKLQKTEMKQKIYAASTQAYKRRKKHASPGTAERAKMNELGERGSLTTADLTVAHDHYERKKLGSDSLVLEKGEDYQATMTTGGGQEVHGLGPYLPSGNGKSVQEIQENIMKETGLTDSQLARAIRCGTPIKLRNYLVKIGKEVSKHNFAQIRRLRQLLSVEFSRGPEVSVSTALEMRKVELGFSTLDDYIVKAPLAPPQATTNIRQARERASNDSSPSSYIPEDIQTAAFNSVFSFTTSFMKEPRPDEDATNFILSLKNEPIDNPEPSEEFLSTIESILRTPQYEYTEYEPPVEEEKSDTEKALGLSYDNQGTAEEKQIDGLSISEDKL